MANYYNSTFRIKDKPKVYKARKPIARRSKLTATKPKVPKLPKPKIWSDKRADDEFSLKIRKRDGKCMYPGCTVTEIKKLQCSHYHGRRHSATRYHEKNCIALCWLHHFKDKLLGYEYQKQTKERHGYDGQYTLFMKKWLGRKEFNALAALAKTTANRANIKLALQRELESLS